MPEVLEVQSYDLYGLGRGLLDAGASFRLKACGWSMYPFVREGDVLEIAPVPFGEIGIGDIVFYRSGSRLLTHRVVGFVSEGDEVLIRARGDGFIQADPPVGESDLVGRVEAIYRPRRGTERVIQLDRGIRHRLGVLIARSKIAHRSVRWAARMIYRVGRAIKGPGFLWHG
jgi:signal peptidase I